MMHHAIKPPWKYSATLLIAARSKTAMKPMDLQKPLFDYKLLLLARSAQSTFMPNVYVFPGGGVSSGDFSPRWNTLFEKSGYCVHEIAKELKSKTQPNILNSANYGTSNPISTDIALRICALRETFEESGVLVAKRCSSFTGSSLYFNSDHGETERKNWRKKIYKNAESFVDMCESLNIVPDVWSLSEWSNWLTPVFSPSVDSSTKRRYDTIFYIYTPDAEYAEDMYVMKDDVEMVQSQWLAPDEALLSMLRGGVPLAPPQIYEILRLANFQHYSELENFHRKRSREGLVLTFPVRFAAEDGVIISLPGDDLYPEEPNYTQPADYIPISGTISQLRQTAQNLHRYEIVKKGPRTFQCNVKQKFGHMSPLDLNTMTKLFTKGKL